MSETRSKRSKDRTPLGAGFQLRSNGVVPWALLLSTPTYPQAGRPLTYLLEVILQFHFLQIWHYRSHQGMRDNLMDRERPELLTQKGTIVDATNIHAPSTTKNEQSKTDPEVHQNRKGNPPWFFAMKLHK